jgi:DNA-binding PadR family transcriptional regulator
MERKGWIVCFQERSGKVYGLTEQGQVIVANTKDIIEEIRNIIQSVLAPTNGKETNRIH